MKKIFIAIIIFTSTHYSIFACTLWGAVGTRVKDGGLLISKNRDFNENSVTSLKKIFPPSGNKYLAMYASEGNIQGPKGGINEHGLVAFTATASTVEKENRLTKSGGKINLILSECKSLDDVLANPSRYLLGRTQFIMIGDRDKIAYIEITPDNQYHIETKTNGVLYHTNHYLFPKFMIYNEKESKNSLMRCCRIGELLESKSIFNLKDMIEISGDKKNGANKSIWREGKPEGGTRTLMNMSISVPKVGSPIVNYKIVNKAEANKTGELILNAIFWKNIDIKY